MALRLTRRIAPEWIELVGGAAVLALPPTTPLVYAARAEADGLLAELIEAGEVVTKAGGHIAGVGNLDDPRVAAGLRETLFVLALAELAVTDWRGVLDSDGSPLTFHASVLGFLLSDANVADAFMRRYLSPINEVVLEGNVSGPLPNGTSARAGEETTATGAKRRGRTARP